MIEKNGALTKVDPINRDQTAYLNLAPVSIVSRSRFEILDLATRYHFKLNGHTDEVWRALFARTVKPPLDAHFQGDEMSFACIPENLEGTYREIKQAVEDTNQAYVKEREAVIEAMNELADQTTKAAETAKKRSQQIKKGFEELEI